MARPTKEQKLAKEKALKDKSFRALFIPIELAESLQTLGFTQLTLTCFYKSGNLETELEYLDYNKLEGCIPAPTFDQVFDWFKIKHGIDFYIRKDYAKKHTFKVWNSFNYLTVYEDDLPELKVKAITHLIELIK